jgi:hypothetical protein
MKRVVLTGMGILCPIGNSPEEGALTAHVEQERDRYVLRTGMDCAFQFTAKTQRTRRVGEVLIVKN